MFLKVVLLLSATAVLGLNLRITPDELKVALETIDAQVKTRQRAASQEIRANLVPLQYYANEAKQQFVSDLTPGAKIYWDEVSALEDEAREVGRDISYCVDVSNTQLYALNDTLYFEMSDNINKLVQDGQDQANTAAGEAGSTLQGLADITEKVSACSDDTCATILEGELVQFYEDAVKTIDDATDSMVNYVFVFLPGALDANALDALKYQEAYAPILSDLRKCVDS